MSINQSSNQPSIFKHSINESVSQSVRQSVSRSINKSITQSTNQSVSHSSKQQTNKPIHPSLINQSVKWSVSQSVCQSSDGLIVQCSTDTAVIQIPLLLLKDLLQDSCKEHSSPQHTVHKQLSYCLIPVGYHYTLKVSNAFNFGFSAATTR